MTTEENAHVSPRASDEADAYVERDCADVEDGYMGLVTSAKKIRNRTRRAFLAGWDAAVRAAAPADPQSEALRRRPDQGPR